MSKSTAIYHSADFDGLFCREIARKFLPGVELVGWNFGDPVVKVPAEGPIYVMDLPLDAVFGVVDGLPHESLQQALAQNRVVWIDHHKTAIEWAAKSGLAGVPGYRLDGVAACRLAWQWLSNMSSDVESLLGNQSKSDFVKRAVDEPMAVRLVGEYDIWDKRDPRAELFQHGLRSAPLTDGIWEALLIDQLGGLIPDIVKQLLDNGESIAYARDQEYREVIQSQGFTVQWDGLCFLCCNSHEQDIRSQLFEAGIKPEHDALLGFTFTGLDWRVSLYGVPGKPDIDLSAIAKKHGGGGHKQACGFRCTGKPPFMPSMFQVLTAN